MSWASMDLDVSITTTMSRPRRSIFCKSYPYCGRASAVINSATARITQLNRTFRRAAEIPTVSADSNRVWMNCASNRCRCRDAHQKNNASAGNASSNHNKPGCSNLMGAS